MSDSPTNSALPRHLASCLCCVDSRLSGPNDVNIFGSRTIGTSFSNTTDPLSYEAIHVFRLIDIGEAYGVHVNHFMEGHYDCKAVVDIWDSRENPLNALPKWLRDIRAPYEHILQQVMNVMGEDYSSDKQRRMFNVIKILEDYRRAMSMDKIKDAADTHRLNLVCTFRDLVEVSPGKWVEGDRYLFNPATRSFIATDLSLTELNMRDGLTRYYAASNHPLNFAAVIENVLKHNGELIDNREIGKPHATRPAHLTATDVIMLAVSAGQNTFQHIPLRQP